MSRVGESLVGKRFGRYTVLKEIPRNDKNRKWECRCDCGAVKGVFQNALTGGRVVSCGCFNKEQKTRHGLEKHPLYSTWRNMVNRCTNPEDARYDDYGGRGIRVCEAWRHSPEQFIADMGSKPKGMSLDRINNDGDYEPGNCRWANTKTQRVNQRGVIMVNGLCLADECKRRGISLSTVYSRIHRSGWDVEKALTTPVRR